MKLKLTIVKECPLCGESIEINVFLNDYYKWNDGAYVQDVFPYLSATERETLISGLCKECQKDVFGEEKS